MIRILLAQTRLSIRVGSCTSDWFTTNLGAPQGDSLSPLLFVCFLAHALHTLRDVASRPTPPISIHGLPMEWAYADDVDFIDEKLDPLTALLPLAKAHLEKFNLKINQSKTEHTHVFLAKKHAKNERGNEPWRKSRLLGSLLCSTQDILHRITLGNAAFQNFWKLWMRRNRITLQKRLRVYDALVVSVMLYNCSSWAAPKNTLEKLDAAHRKHLRRILGVGWPKAHISNEELYKRCKSTPLSQRVMASRRQMLGHILRLPEDSPGQCALHFAVVESQQYQARRGRHCTNLLDVLRSDLQTASIHLKTSEDYRKVKEIAQDKHKWRCQW